MVPEQAPQHTPASIVSFYDQACRALARCDADVAGMGFRKVLDTATRTNARLFEPECRTPRQMQVSERIVSLR
jgi:hypothetical protein